MSLPWHKSCVFSGIFKDVYPAFQQRVQQLHTHTSSYHADDKVVGNSTLQVLDTSPSKFLNDGVTFLNDYGDSAKGET